MAQGGPQEGDTTLEKDGISFSIEDGLSEIVNFFEIDYAKGWLRKGFAIYPNGSKASC
ncbi:MAG: hypothetical protein ACM3ZR_01355 [Pseudomonadota bacterium]